MNLPRALPTVRYNTAHQPGGAYRAGGLTRAAVGAACAVMSAGLWGCWLLSGLPMSAATLAGSRGGR